MWKPWRRSVSTSGPIQIVDLPDRHVGSYLVCLEDWSSEMDEAGDHKAHWYEKARDEGLRVKLALDDEDRPLGMIQYVPIELSPATGEDLYVVLCIWVHGYKDGVGDAQGRGIGTALLAAAEDDARGTGGERDGSVGAASARLDEGVLVQEARLSRCRSHRCAGTRVETVRGGGKGAGMGAGTAGGDR